MSTTDVQVQRASHPAGRAAWVCLVMAWIFFLLPIPFMGLVLGWPLNLVAFVLAVVAMAVRGTWAGLWQLLASLIVSPIVYFAGWVVMLGMFAGSASVEQTRLDTFEGNGAVEAIETMDEPASSAAPEAGEP